MICTNKSQKQKYQNNKNCVTIVGDLVTKNAFLIRMWIDFASKRGLSLQHIAFAFIRGTGLNNN